jgi:hypothetical protein
MVERKENAYAGRQTQGEINNLVGFSKTPTIRVKLNRSDV